MHYEDVIPAIDRILLITWLLKDFGWMSTNIYLGWPFGICAILFHTIALLFDPRRAFRYYNISFLLWVTGNWIWMTIEFVSEPLSSDIHWGPHVPIGKISLEAQQNLNFVKIALFITSLLVQFLMYIGIYCKYIEMPRHFDEDMVSTNELTLLFGGKGLPYTKSWRFVSASSSYGVRNINEIYAGVSVTSTPAGKTALPMRRFSDFNGDSDVLSLPASPTEHEAMHHTASTLNKRSNSSMLPNSEDHDESEDATLGISTALVEYTYIIFWICKDLFWSIGTGDLHTSNTSAAIVFETVALFFGTVAFCVYLISAYIYRRSLLAFLDSLTTLLWICANFVWMSGEFFLRYQNLLLDDYDEGNDRITRICSTIFFTTGLTIQAGIIVYLSCECPCISFSTKQRSRNGYRVHFGPLQNFELDSSSTAFNPIKTQPILEHQQQQQKAEQPQPQRVPSPRLPSFDFFAIAPQNIMADEYRGTVGNQNKKKSLIKTNASAPGVYHSSNEDDDDEKFAVLF